MTAFLDRLFSLEGRVALVTGGSSGIGRAMAGALGRAGAGVVLLARGEAALADTAAWLRADGCRAAWVSADLADRAGVERAAAAATGPLGEPDIVVNAAGLNIRPELAALTPADWDRLMAVNLTAPFLLGQRFGPAMAGRGWGRIINIASQQAMRAFGNSGGYGATKGGLVSLTRSQSEAWAPRGVCCNAIAPGFVATPLTRRGRRRPGPLGRAGRPHHDRPQRRGRRLRGHRRLPGQPGQRLRHRPAHLRGRRLLRHLTRAHHLTKRIRVMIMSVPPGFAWPEPVIDGWLAGSAAGGPGREGTARRAGNGRATRSR